MPSKKILIPVIAVLPWISACNKDVTIFADVHFSFAFDSTQTRLDNLGEPSEVPAGHGSQSPEMQLMSIHYIELTTGSNVQLGDGAVLYKAPETLAGGAQAILFDSSILASEGSDFLQIKLERLAPGTYTYLRASVAYQQFGISYDLHNVPIYGDVLDQDGVLASFLGYNTYINDLHIQNLTTSVNANKEQGFWGFETLFSGDLSAYNAIYTGQAPEGATTVVNPINATSPIPAGSCVVTGMFAEPLVITGDEVQDLYITFSFSTNNSFEWIDSDTDGKWDIDVLDAGATESVVDMGIRGMIPSWEWRD
ncbi:MAG TPA: hypothetical protein PK511_06065 [Chitinophagales bacterium]|nr:hypothetical protein [Chitinophagales bacterium]HMZ87983.1 hypothetical protein [Chitinophagales bacterium]HNA56663.1 hypothetical protein [Chitinophagales bacterium]HNI54066.1 hypothetical protein [Chitinophagales bacterium]HNJ88773.1 hypothetical protein [Chitinophagales bacterium]